MGIIGRLDQYGSMLAGEFDETTLNNPSITGLSTYYASEFSENIDYVSQANHGYSNWYCLVSGTATYSIVNSTGGIIYEIDGSITTAKVTATAPQRGTFAVVAGRKYYGNVPINLVVEDQQHSIAPLTMVGTQFWSISARADIPPTTFYNPTIYYIHSPYNTATVNFYDGSSTGLVGIATSTITINVGGIGTFASSTNNNHWISSNTPVLASVTRNSADKTILSPMSNYVYQRFQSYNNTTNNTTPTNLNSYVTYDSTYKVMNMNIADGSGGDCAQGLGLEYLSDTYSWGNVVSDYVIVCPYTTTVVVSYWNGSAWVVLETHSNIAGTITSPGFVSRDGTTGVGIAATIISGGATNMASGATLWKWEGTQPFYLAINDSADDEFSVLGWNQSRTPIMPANVFPPYDLVYDDFGGTLFGAGQGRYMRQNTDKSVIVYNEIDEVTDFRDIVRTGLVLDLDAAQSLSYNGTGTTWTDLSGIGNNGTLVNTPAYNSANSGYFNFDYTQSESVTFASSSSLQFLNRLPYTLEAWVYPTRNPGASNWTGIFDREDTSIGSRDGYNLYFLGSATTDTFFTTERFVAGTNSSTFVTLNQSVSVNAWQHIVATYDGTTLTLYRNGSSVGTPATSTGNITNTSKTLTIGVRGGQYFGGRIANAKIYSTSLTSTQILQNYNALKHRFGL